MYLVGDSFRVSFKWVVIISTKQEAQTCKSSADPRNSADFDIFWVILEICPEPRRK